MVKYLLFETGGNAPDWWRQLMLSSGTLASNEEVNHVFHEKYPNIDVKFYCEELPDSNHWRRDKWGNRYLIFGSESDQTAFFLQVS